MRYTVFHLEASLAKSTWSQNPIVSWEWLCKLFISWFCVKKIWSLNNLLWRFILQAFLLNNNNHNNNKKKRIKNMKDRLGILPAFLPSPECMHSGICYDWVFNNLFGAHCCSHYFHVHAPQVMSLKISRWLQLLTVWVDYITERQHLTTHVQWLVTLLKLLKSFGAGRASSLEKLTSERETSERVAHLRRDRAVVLWAVATA